MYLLFISIAYIFRIELIDQKNLHIVLSMSIYILKKILLKFKKLSLYNQSSIKISIL